jgi:hypothetical protein
MTVNNNTGDIRHSPEEKNQRFSLLNITLNFYDYYFYLHINNSVLCVTQICF